MIILLMVRVFRKENPQLRTQRDVARCMIAAGFAFFGRNKNEPGIDTVARSIRKALQTFGLCWDEMDRAFVERKIRVKGREFTVFEPRLQ